MTWPFVKSVLVRKKFDMRQISFRLDEEPMPIFPKKLFTANESASLAIQSSTWNGMEFMRKFVLTPGFAGLALFMI